MKKYILSEHFKFLGKSSSKLCNFKINYYNKISKVYISDGLVHGQEKFKPHVGLGIISTSITNTYN